MAKVFRLGLLFVISITLLIPNFAFAAPDQSQNNTTVQTDDNNSAKVESENENEIDDNDCTKDIKLTKDQIKNLDSLYDKWYKDYKEILEAYTEYGALTKQDKKEKLKIMEKYIKIVKKHDYKLCEEYENEDEDFDDKWEWLDND